MADVRDLCTAALREIGVLAGGEAATYEDANDALDTLNRMVDQYAAERLMIFHMGRYEFDIFANYGEYEIGTIPVNDSGTPTYSETVTDGFDTTWADAPPGWTVATTGDATVQNYTVTYQAGGHSVKLDSLVGGGGLASFYREFTLFAGSSVTISAYMTRDTAGASIAAKILCKETAHYLTSGGVWQAAAANVFTDTGATFTLHTITFTMEAASVIGADAGTLRVTFYTDSTTAHDFGLIDTFALTETVPGTTGRIVPGIAIPRPIYIDHVNLLDTSLSPDQETPLDPLTDDAWSRISLKDQTSTQPTAWYYNPFIPTPTFSRNPTFPFGTLNLWPVPTGTTLKGVIYMPTQVTRFAGLSSLVSLPPGYERMIVKNLALELCPTYGRNPHPALVQQAADAKAVVKRSNKRLSDLSFPAETLIGGGGGGYDIRTDR